MNCTSLLFLLVAFIVSLASAQWGSPPQELPSSSLPDFFGLYGYGASGGGFGNNGGFNNYGFNSWDRYRSNPWMKGSKAPCCSASLFQTVGEAVRTTAAAGLGESETFSLHFFFLYCLHLFHYHRLSILFYHFL